MNKYQFAATGFAVLLLVGAPPVRAEEPPIIAVTIQDHQFTPAEIHVRAGQPVVLRVTNADATVEEFDSSALKVEKLIVAGQYALVRLRPLGAGRYEFMGEFHPETAKGVVIADP